MDTDINTSIVTINNISPVRSRTGTAMQIYDKYNKKYQNIKNLCWLLIILFLLLMPEIGIYMLFVLLFPGDGSSGRHGIGSPPSCGWGNSISGYS